MDWLNRTESLIGKDKSVKSLSQYMHREAFFTSILIYPHLLQYAIVTFFIFSPKIII